MVTEEGEGIRIIGAGAIEFLNANVKALTPEAKAERVAQAAAEREATRVWRAKYDLRCLGEEQGREGENVKKFFAQVHLNDLEEGASGSQVEAKERIERNQGPRGALSVAQVHQLLTGCEVCATETDKEVLESFKAWADKEAVAQGCTLALYWFIKRASAPTARRNLEWPLQVHPTPEGVAWLEQNRAAGLNVTVNDLPFALRARPVEPTALGYRWLKESGKTLAELPEGWQYGQANGQRPAEPATARLLQIEHANIAFGRSPLPSEEQLREVGWNGAAGSLRLEDCQVWLRPKSNNLFGVPDKPKAYRSWRVLHPATLAKYPGLVGGAVGFTTESERATHDAELRGQ